MKTIIIIILMSVMVLGYNNIEEFDMNENIVISTTVYDTDGQGCDDCTCNLTLYNTTPNEEFIYLNTLMDNKNNGIYSKDLSSIKTIEYSDNIYPLKIICTNPSGISSGDNRDGIKVSETTFDYSSGIFVFIGVAIIFVIMAFWVDERFKGIKLLSFFSSFVFMALGIITGYTIMLQSPTPTSFKLIFTTGITAFMMIVLGVIYFYGHERLADLADNLFGKGGYKEKNYR